MCVLCSDSKEKKNLLTNKTKQKLPPLPLSPKKGTIFFLAHKLVWDRKLQQVFISEESEASLT